MPKNTVARRVPIRFLGIALCALLLSSCNKDPLAQYINSKWAPVDVTQQREAAIATAASALARLPNTNVAFNIRLADVAQISNGGILKKFGITKLEIVGDHQLIQVTANFDKHFEASDLPADSKNAALLSELSPDVSGKLVFYAGITGGISKSDDTGTARIDLRILPALQSVSINKAQIKGKYDVPMVGDLIVGLLNRYAANVSGQIANMSAMKLSVPSSFPANIDPATAIHDDKTNPNVSFKVSGSPIASSVALTGVTWLISEDRVLALTRADIGKQPTVAEANTPSTNPPPTYEDFKGHFESLLQSAFMLPADGGQSWAAIRKDLVAGMVNTTVAEASLCAAGSAILPEQKFSSQIKFPDASSISCDSDRDCQPTRVCNAGASHDERDCSICVLYRPGWPISDGGCAQRSNNPICEAAKLAQNQLYKADQAAQNLDCERLRFQEKSSCEIEKAGAKTLCETGKAFISGLARTGKFADLDGSASGKTKDLKTCISNFNLSPSLDNVQASLTVQGSADAIVNLKFVPLDIVGHLACQFPWTESQRFNASIRGSSISLSSGVQFLEVGGRDRVKFLISGGSVPLRLRPGPTEFLLKSVNMTLACQGLNLVKPLILTLTPFIPELRGEIDYKYDEQQVSIDLTLPNQTVGNIPIAGKVQTTNIAIVISGAPSSVTTISH